MCRYSGTAAMPVEQCHLLKPLDYFDDPLGLHYFLQEIAKHPSTCSCHRPSLRDLVFRGSMDGTTPLLLACHHGDLQWVKRLVKTWNVDINASAVYYQQSDFFLNDRWEKFCGATPVFVAAFNGHLDIVQYLVGKKQISPPKLPVPIVYMTASLLFTALWIRSPITRSIKTWKM